MIGKLRKEEEVSQRFNILDIISKDKFLSNDSNKVIYESELLKFSPGIKENHYLKWAQLTCHEFRYYKDHISAVGWPDHPLVTLPLHRIERVERVAVRISSARTPQLPHQFEIFLRDAGDKRPAEEVPKNSVSQMPSSHSLYTSQLRRSALASGMSIKDKRQYIDYVNNNAAILSKVAMKEQIKGSKKLKGLAGSDTWSNRECIWKQLKERHIYAHEDKLECEKWVFVLNWLIDLLKES